MGIFADFGKFAPFPSRYIKDGAIAHSGNKSNPFNLFLVFIELHL